jgi:hypothetical protein
VFADKDALALSANETHSPELLSMFVVRAVADPPTSVPLGSEELFVCMDARRRLVRLPVLRSLTSMVETVRAVDRYTP